MRQNAQKAQPPSPTNEIQSLPQQKAKTNPAEIVSSTDSSNQMIPQVTTEAESKILFTNALTATNLEQWTNAIKNLKPLAGFKFDQHWLIEQLGRTNSLPITLRVDDSIVKYSTVLISVNAENESGKIIRIEMQTPNMNISETRELGVQLCNMFRRNPSDFLAWCDKVGNHWLDAPLYSSRNIRIPDNNEIFGFQTLRTSNDEKPWMINFVITSP